MTYRRADQLLNLWLLVLALAAAVAITLVWTAPADSAPRQSNSPVKGFQDAPDGYSNIIAGCLGRNGWYETNVGFGQATPSNLVVIAADPNCVKGGALNP